MTDPSLLAILGFEAIARESRCLERDNGDDTDCVLSRLHVIKKSKWRTG